MTNLTRLCVATACVTSFACGGGLAADEAEGIGTDGGVAGSGGRWQAAAVMTMHNPREVMTMPNPRDGVVATMANFAPSWSYSKSRVLGRAIRSVSVEEPLSLR